MNDFMWWFFYLLVGSCLYVIVIFDIRKVYEGNYEIDRDKGMLMIVEKYMK